MELQDYIFTYAGYVLTPKPDRECQVGVEVFIDREPRYPFQINREEVYMKTRFPVITCGFIILIANAPAWASPNVSFRQQNSAYFATASNSEDRSCNCSGTVTANYFDYGTQKNTTINVNFTVPAKASNQDVWNWQTSFTTSGLSFSPNINCN